MSVLHGDFSLFWNLSCYDLLCQTQHRLVNIVTYSGVGGGGAGGSSAAPKVLICQKSGQNPWKFGQNLWQSGQNPWKSEQNPGKNGSQRCLISKNGAQWLEKNTLRFFWRLHKNKVFMIFVGKMRTETFRAKILHNPKHFACSYIYG